MKQRAITEDHLYRRVYRKGKKFAGRLAVVYALRDYDNARLRRTDPLHRRFNRVGLTVTKKLGNAVVRVRVRRILREGYRALEPELATGWLLVLAAREAAVGAKSTDIAADLRRAFTKLDLFRTRSDDNDAAKTGAAVNIAAVKTAAAATDAAATDAAATGAAATGAAVEKAKDSAAVIDSAAIADNNAIYDNAVIADNNAIVSIGEDDVNEAGPRPDNGRSDPC